MPLILYVGLSCVYGRDIYGRFSSAVLGYAERNKRNWGLELRKLTSNHSAESGADIAIQVAEHVKHFGGEGLDFMNEVNQQKEE